MLGRRSSLKYKVVDSDELVENAEETADYQKHPPPTIAWTWISTGILILLYFIPSVGLTFYQRWFLQNFEPFKKPEPRTTEGFNNPGIYSVASMIPFEECIYRTFKYPLTTVMIHMVTKLCLSSIARLLWACKFGKQHITVSWKEYVFSMAPTGIFSGIDIGFSNWGLELITITLYTMTKSTTIIFILFFSIAFKLEKKSWSLCFIVILIAFGLFLFTYKLTQFNLFGFVLLLFASMFSGLRWTYVQLILQKSKMGMKNPIDMIFHMQPFMIMSLLPFTIWIEGSSLISMLDKQHNDTHFILGISLKILLGGLIAFLMEIMEVLVVSYTSSLTLSIAGIIKEMVMMMLAIVINGDSISVINFFGLIVCMGGIVTHVVHKIKSTRQMQYPLRPQREGKELEESLMYNFDQLSGSDSETERNDSQVLFNILNSRDR